jgi:hypothetical protein
MGIKSVVFFMLGGAILAVAFFAEALGLDNDPGWGRGRIAILVFGILTIAFGLFYSLYSDIILSTSHKLQSFVSQKLTSLFGFVRRNWYIFPVLILVILVYVWFASSGSWTRWEPATRYYAELATSFKHGHLHLLDEPNEKLLSLSNPYDPSARQGVNYFIDYSLYQGKYYLYWGPVPALLLIVIDPFTRGRVADLYLVFYFVCGIFLLQSLFVMMMRDRFFRDLPKWISLLSIFVLGLITPWTYMLINEPNGRIYEASISAAQFFLVSGFLVAVVALDRPAPSSLLLALTGFLWALAIGTRLVIALPVGFLSLMIAYRLWKTMHLSPLSLAGKLLSLSWPLILCLVGSGWYNWARFGSLTETGISYQLAGVNQNYGDALFSPAYFAQNLYTYLFHPPSVTPHFPFLYPREIAGVGLFFIAPFTMFAILSVTPLLPQMPLKPSSSPKAHGMDLLDWIITSLFGSFLAAFGLLLISLWTMIRYLADFMPALTILSILGFWQGYQFLAQTPRYQRMYSTVGIILAGATITVNILLSISVRYLGRTGF